MRPGDPIAHTPRRRRHERAPSRPSSARRRCAPSRPRWSASPSTTSSLQTTVTLLNLAARKAGLGRPAEGPAPTGAGAPGDRGRPRAPAAARAAPRRPARPGPRHAVAAADGLRAAVRRGRRRRRRRSRGGERRRAAARAGSPAPARAARARRSAPAGSGCPASSQRSGRATPRPSVDCAAVRRRPCPAAVFVLSERLAERSSLVRFPGRPRGVVALVCASSPWRTAWSRLARCWRCRPATRSCVACPPPIQEGASAYLRRQYPTIAHRRRRPVRRADLAAEHRGRDRLPDRRPGCRRRPASSA